MWSRNLFDEHRRSSLEHPKTISCLICRAGFLTLKTPSRHQRVTAVAADVLELRDCVRYDDGEPVLRLALHSMRHGLATWLPYCGASERDPAYAPELFAEQDDALYSQ